MYSTHYFEDFADKIINRINGNIAFIHCASNLGNLGIITKRFKDSGMTTVELQHGYVGPEHYSYNYPKGDSTIIAKEYLPDYYLTFGRYWTERIQTPSKVVTVGNPSLNFKKNILERQFSPIPHSILIVSQGIVTPKMVEIAKYLSKNLPRYKIIFKLHPGEVYFFSRYAELNKYHNIQIKMYENIYELIALSEIIIGYNSTSLFEAVAFKNKRIFIVDNEYIPDSLGFKFSCNEELLDAIVNEDLGYSLEDPSFFWEPNWEENICSFFEKVAK